MTKRERLDGLMRAAEMLHRHAPMTAIAAVWHSSGSREAIKFRDFSSLYKQTKSLGHSKQAKLTRQLAVLMYREAVKRGEA